MDDCANAQYPPITGKLREKLAEYKPTEGKCNLITRAVGSTGYARLVELCDTIDAIHARLEAAYDHLRAERDSMAAALDRAEGEHDFAPESHYVMLPKDADGEPIHVGERVQLIGNDPSIVSHMSLADDGWRVYVKYDGGIGTGSGEPKRIRHYHAPTVEDVLREFGDKYCDVSLGSDAESELFAEYAAKLRLAGDAE